MSVANFARLFHGRWDAIGLDRGGVERRPVTLGDYEGHYAGHRAVGIFPMLDDGTVWFGAIDLDEPDFELARQMQTLIPGASWIERSRSGNAHVWVFFEAPAPAWAVRTILRGATESVGRPDVEIFPKQDALKAGMVGNYINLPLFGDERPILGFEQFTDGTPTGPAERAFGVRAMIETRQAPADWERRARRLGGVPPAEREETSEWGESPTLHICAEYIIQRRESYPLAEGARHVVLFNLAKQLLNYREFDEREAWDYLREVNDASCHPLPQQEIRRLFGNAVDGRWTSTGCDDPQMVGYTHPDCPIANS